MIFDFIPKPPGRVDRNNLESLKEHYAYADQLCKLYYKMAFAVVVCAVVLLVITKHYSHVPGVEIPLKLLYILLPLVTIILIALQSFMLYYRKSFKTLIDQFPSE